MAAATEREMEQGVLDQLPVSPGVLGGLVVFLGLILMLMGNETMGMLLIAGGAVLAVSTAL